MDLIEFGVAQAVTKAHLAEAVLHGTGSWAMSLGSRTSDHSDLMAAGFRMVENGRVSIEAEFPPHCWLHHRATLLTLWHNGEMVAVREVDHPGDGSFLASWSFSIQVVEQAA